MIYRIFLLSLSLTAVGCTSFKTTVLQRGSDSRFYPNFPCAKTKGIPVKLKVPTHLEVKIVESFFMQDSSGAKADANAKKAAKKLAAANTAKTNTANKLTAAKAIQAKAAAALKKKPTDAMLKKKKQEADNAVAAATTADNVADAAVAVAKQDDVDAKEVKAAVVPKYSEAKVMCGGQRLRTHSIETKLCYTDKVFTVDFRRPAGGVLNLSSITMDSEQYFKSIAADYEEQTLQQVNAALGTLKTGEPAEATAKTGSVEVPEGAKELLGAGTRVVALTRFDISDPNWEAQLHGFIDKHVTGCFPDCPVAEYCPQTP